MSPDAAEELLVTVREMARTQAAIARRQVAMEQLFERMRDDLERWQVQIDRATEAAARIAVLEYQVTQLTDENTQLFALQRITGTRLLLILITILIVLAILGVPIAILLFR